MTATTIEQFACAFNEAADYFCRLFRSTTSDACIVLVRALEDEDDATPESLSTIWRREVDEVPVDMEAIEFCIAMRAQLGSKWHVALLAVEERDWAADRWQDEGHEPDESIGDQFDNAESRWDGDCTMFDHRRAKEDEAAKRWMARASKAA